MPSRSQYESYLQLPQVKAALDTIAWAEGGKGYNTLFGGSTFESRGYDYNSHPGAQGFYVASWNTTAAGRYQIVWSTYKALAPPLGISDFSRRSQDILALAEASRKGGLSNIVAGNFAAALQDLGRGGRCAWAALPYSGCGQKQRPLDQTLNYYKSALAAYGGSPTTLNENPVSNSDSVVNDNDNEDSSLLYVVGGIVLLALLI